MMRAAIAFALFGAAFAATPAHACLLFAGCSEEAVYVAPYEADLPPPRVLEMVKRREDGGLSLAGFYNEPFASPEAIYAPAGAWRRHDGYARRFRVARFHAHTCRP